MMGHKIYVNGKDFALPGMEEKLPSVDFELAHAFRSAFLKAVHTQSVSIVGVYVDGVDCGCIEIDCTHTIWQDFPDNRETYDELFEAYNKSRWSKQVTSVTRDSEVVIDASSIFEKLVGRLEVIDLDRLNYAKDEL